MECANISWQVRINTKGLKQMVLQLLQNAGEEGVKRNAVYDYLTDVLPQAKTKEQKLRMVGKLLVEMNEGQKIKTNGRRWFLGRYYDTDK